MASGYHNHSRRLLPGEKRRALIPLGLLNVWKQCG
jgi:hypothetical protein